MKGGGSGFGWDLNTGLSTPLSVWKGYLRSNPKAKHFQDKPLVNYAELHEIFRHVVATGNYAASSSQTAASSQPSGDGGQDRERDGDDDVDADGFSDSGSVSAGPSSQATKPQSSNPRHSRRSSIDDEDLSTPKRRRTNGDRISTALEKIASNHEKRTETKAKARTQLQEAISTSTNGIGQSMTVDTQIRHINYFTQNPTAAEAFNILDADMQEPFIASLNIY